MKTLGQESGVRSQNEQPGFEWSEKTKTARVGTASSSARFYSHACLSNFFILTPVSCLLHFFFTSSPKHFPALLSL
jgi:hypothetical protein